ncbi:MAG: Gfo/Idh/MocA family oxidoreductase [Clostridiales bacterium]|nr:Gfo/Idh/MocA family oxidoreductase [Clostridiales bacterium]
MLRVAMLSKWHVHAEGYAKFLQGLDNVQITAVWDEEPERGRKWAEDLKADFEEDLDTLLKRDDVDGVVVDAPTSMHADVMVAAANAGKHIFTEKAMALTVEECNRISEAVRKAGVKFCISFPARTAPQNLYAKKLIDEGILGDITLVRIRNGHDGSLRDWLPDYWYDEKMAGGGAMMDLGCHPMYLASWFLGKPARITSMYNYFTGRAVEDNAVCAIEFKNKAVAIVETSLVTYRTPGSLEIYGTEGTLIAIGRDVKLISEKMPEKFKGWVSPQDLPKPLDPPLKQWVDAITLGTPIRYDLEEGTKLTELLEASYIAHKEKREVEFK